MCKCLDFPKSPFTPSQSTGAVFQHLSLLSGDQLTGRSPPCLRCCQSCFPPHLTGDTCEFTWPLWEVRVSLNSFTSVGPGRYKPATPALSSFLHHAVLRNSPFPSITPVPLWGEQDPFPAALQDALWLRVDLQPDLCSVGKRRFRRPSVLGSNQRKATLRPCHVVGDAFFG